MADEPQADAAGAPELKFAHYRVLRRPDGAIWELGRGAMGVTYKAFDEQLRVDVALKIITPAQVDDPKTQALFLREARAAARVHHPNVAGVVFLSTVPGNFFYAMEFVAGESLQDWRRARRSIAPRMAVSFAAQIARGLEAIHAQQVVHRDLKPANLMIVSTGRGKPGESADTTPSAWQIKIIDFGLARPFAGGSLSSVHEAPTTGFRGTALYASPEQCLERSDIDGRSDQYALGCILFEMLTGAPPFRSRSLHELMSQHVSQRPPLEQLSHLPAGLQAVVARMLEKDPANRYADDNEAAEALEDCAARIDRGEDVIANPGVTTIMTDLRPPSRATTLPLTGVPAPARRFSTRVVFAGLALVAAAFSIWRLSRPDPTPAAPSTPAAPLVSTAVASSTPAPPVALSRKSIAVLPFENRSAEKENEYLTDGIHEDILTNLSRVQDLKVVSRGAVLGYKAGANRNLRQIANELGVGSVLEGSVQRSGNRIRVTTQLVDTASSQSVWADTYDRQLTDVLEIQTQISQEIAKALTANLSPAEIKQLAQPPTKNPAAYDEYLRGREAAERRGWQRDGNEEAIRHYERAVELDPDFALAYAELGRRNALSFQSYWDTSEARAERSRQAVANAMRLQPDLPQVIAARANYLFRVEHKNDEALSILRTAERKSPDDVSLLMSIGNLLRRRDRMDEALEYFRRAERLAPKDPDPPGFQAAVLYWTRRFAEQEKALRRLLVLSPDPGVEEYIAISQAHQMNDWDFYTREALRLDPAMSPEQRVNCRFFRRDFRGVLEALQGVKGDMVGSTPKSIVTAGNQLKLGNRVAADEAFREAETSLRIAVEERPRDRSARLLLAYACAGLGKREEAIRLAEEALEAAPEAEDVVESRELSAGYADVCGFCGDFDRACKMYRHLLEVPSTVTRFMLRNDPTYDDFKKNPQFAALIAEPGP